MRNRKKSERPWSILLWGLTFLWLGICFILSSQNGTQTGQLSMGLSQFIIRLLELSQDSLYLLNSHLRTSAHVVVFWVLTLLGGCASGASSTQHRSAPLWPFFPGTLFAVLDEVRKANIPGRHCSFSEAGLNVIGCVLGCCTAYLICRVHRRRAFHKMKFYEEFNS